MQAMRSCGAPADEHVGQVLDDVEKREDDPVRQPGGLRLRGRAASLGRLASLCALKRLPRLKRRVHETHKHAASRAAAQRQKRAGGGAWACMRHVEAAALRTAKRTRNARRGAARRNAHPNGLHRSAPTRSWPIICGCELAAARKLRRGLRLAAGDRRRRCTLRPTTRRGSRAPGTAVHTRRRRACTVRGAALHRHFERVDLAETAHSAALPPLLRVRQRVRGPCVAACFRGVRCAPQRPRRASSRGRASPLSAFLVSHDEERRWRAPGVDAAGACARCWPACATLHARLQSRRC